LAKASRHHHQEIAGQHRVGVIPYEAAPAEAADFSGEFRLAERVSAMLGYRRVSLVLDAVDRDHGAQQQCGSA